MWIDISEMVVHMKQFVIVIFRTSYKSVCNHPFLVAMILFVVYLYGSSPFIFSLLVSSLPVLICTAVLLGILLSYGQVNLPDIEEENEELHHTASLQTTVALSEDASGVMEREESCSAQRFLIKGGNIVKKSDKNAKENICLSSKDDYSLVYVPLIDESTRRIQHEKLVNREYHNLGFEEEEILNGSGNRIVIDDDVDVENSCFEVPGVRFKIPERKNAELDQLDSSLESSNSESDQAESSSPDASMDDIIPMLDELHPLLDSEAPQPLHDDDLDNASQQYHKSTEGSDESDQDIENQGEVDIDEEEEAQVGEDIVKSAITWTEDDQKNLANLGTSELERNQRLENLIARRRARKNMRSVAEKNLIDLEVTDHPFQVAPVSTGKLNPFDLPEESIEELDLLDIPGSAPSILLPARNPFDIPYESNEERPILTGAGFQQEFMPLHQKDTSLFRRHESFSVGPSVLGAANVKPRPYFLPEKFFPEGTSYPPPLQMQSNVELEDKKIPEQGISHEAEMIFNMDNPSVSVELGSSTFGYSDSEDADSDDSDQAKSCDNDLSNLQTKISGIINESIINLKTEEGITDEKDRGGLTTIPQIDCVFESGNSMQPSVHNPGLEMTGEVNNSCDTCDPVYDSSPPAAKKLMSSISSEIHAQIPEMGSPPLLFKPSKIINKLQQPSLEDEPHSSVSSPMGGPPVENDSMDKEKSHQYGKAETEDGKLVSTDSSYMEQKSLSEVHKLPAVVMPMVEHSIDDEKEIQNSKAPETEPAGKIFTINNEDPKAVMDDLHVGPGLVTKHINGEAAENKETESDKSLLSELDDVGDFSAKETVSDKHEIGIQKLDESKPNPELRTAESRTLESVPEEDDRIEDGSGNGNGNLDSDVEYRIEVSISTMSDVKSKMGRSENSSSGSSSSSSKSSSSSDSD